MKRLLVLALVLAWSAPAGAAAAGFQKAYFGATKAGAFAR